MKVLWFVGSSLKGSFYRTFWVSSLLKELSKEKGLEIGICFLSSEKNIKEYKEDNISYFPVSSHRSFIHRLIKRLTHSIKGANNFNDYISVVEKFKPDLINIFGIETEYAEIISHVNCKSVIHIQGILSPLIEFWNIPNKNNRNAFFSTNLIHLLFGVGIFHAYIKIKKAAIRERKMLSHAKYVFGRTDWDKNVMKVLAPNANYFHIDEVIRDDFFDTIWEYKKTDQYTLITIIGDDIYKGYDVLLKTAALLNEHHLNYNWKIFGISNESESVQIIEKMLNTKPSSSVKLMGNVDAKTLVDAMKSGHLYVHPSRIENSPNSVCEATLMGMPVIAAQTGGVSTIIEDNVSGLLFPNMDFYALAATILTYIKQPEVLQEMGKNARQIALQRHSKEKIINDLLNAYKKIISE